MPPITLLVPCYNAARYLPRLASSVGAQTVPFADILLYDDGSSDDTVAVARSLGWRILTPNTNAGPAAARNRLLAAVSAEWIHFHDADDVLDPAFVEKMSAALAATPASDIVLCHMDWIDEIDASLHVAWRYSGPDLASDPVTETIRNPVGVIACVYRRTFLSSIGGFDETYRIFEDGDLHVRLAAAGARFKVVPEILSIGLRHSRGASNDRHVLIASRVAQLERYATSYPQALPAILNEAEKLAASLACRPGEKVLFSRLLDLCSRHRHPLPSSPRWPWRIIRRALSPGSALRLQVRLRKMVGTLGFRPPTAPAA